MSKHVQFVLVALGCIGLSVYFIQHTRYGRYGLEAQASLERQLELVELRISRLESVRDVLRRDIALLDGEQPDRDLTEELAQVTLGYVYPDAEIILTRVQ